MGFSTSGSFLLIITGFFVAFGTLYTATANTTEQIHDAQEDRRAYQESVRGVAIEVAAASYDAGADDFEVRLHNTGEQALSVDDVDVVVDGAYVPLSAFETVTVDGGDTDRWLPGQQLRLVDTDRTNAPGRVKVVVGPGVSVVEEVP
ncbi:flagellin [Halobacteriales archaeon Cl-PHB]